MIPKTMRQREALERQEAHNKLSIDQKIAKVKYRGGSKKELAKLMEKKNAPKKTPKKKDINTNKK